MKPDITMADRVLAMRANGNAAAPLASATARVATLARCAEFVVAVEDGLVKVVADIRAVGRVHLAAAQLGVWADKVSSNGETIWFSIVSPELCGRCRANLGRPRQDGAPQECVRCGPRPVTDVRRKP